MNALPRLRPARYRRTDRATRRLDADAGGRQRPAHRAAAGAEETGCFGAVLAARASAHRRRIVLPAGPTRPPAPGAHVAADGACARPYQRKYRQYRDLIAALRGLSRPY